MNLSLLVWWPLAAALIAAAPLPRRARDLWLPFALLVELAGAAVLFTRLSGDAAVLSFSLPDICLNGFFLVADRLRALLVAMTAFAFACAGWFAPAYLAHDHHRARFDAFTLITLAGTMGVFLAADLFTLFLCFEVMSLASWGWVAHEDNAPARYAADAYLAVAVLGGLVLLMGLFLLNHLAGTLVISELYAACAPLAGSPALYVTGTLLLLGFGAKAGMFPLHFWLPMAHPVAPAPASALLSGVLTKCGVFGVLVLAVEIFRADARWGETVLLLGLITMLAGAVLALFSTDLKRTLACSSVSQIGFILLGVGLIDLLGAENELAARGTLLHMVNHCLIKTVLFLAAGVFAMHRHTLSLNRLRGAGRGCPVLMASFLIGALSIAGVPLTSGYVSKTLLHEAVTEYVAIAGASLQARAVEWLFLLAGGMTAAYMAKLFYALFLARPAQDTAPLRLDLRTGVIALPALLLLVFGLAPHAVMDRLAALAVPSLHAVFSHHIAYLAPVNLLGAGISLAIGALLYFLLVRRLTENGMLQNKWPVWLDLERILYRPLLTRLLPAVCGLVCRCLDQLADGVVVLLRCTILRPNLTHATQADAFGPAHRLGRMLDRLTARRTKDASFVQIFARWERSAAASARLIGASLSFGLLMFCLGLFLTLLYLLL